jgi:hypothetical protein
VLPNFLIIGAMKAGTSSLYQYLRAHPHVFLARPKELHYFVAQLNLPRGAKWYEDHFAGAGSARAVGEASVTYSMRSCFPGVPERVRAVMPEARLIYVLRHPVERMRSHYLHACAQRTEGRDADTALTRNLDYFHTSRYSYQLDAWLEHFPRVQLLVLTADDLRHDREATLARVCDFLDLDPTGAAADQVAESHHTSDKRVGTRLTRPLLAAKPWKQLVGALPAPARKVHDRLLTVPALPDRARISPGTEQLLLDGLRPDLERLREVLGQDFHCWGLV